ncbi:MAG: amidohydrolase family protein [Chloroflexi bacterium]|nr:amidohydrolase family protein [Chloroflexota bacterium]
MSGRHTIDVDAHVIETERTWDYLEGEDRRFRPIGEVVETLDGPREFWLIDGRLVRRRQNIGRETSEETREMANVKARLQHMDELGVGVQVLFPTLFLTAFTHKPEVELALSRSYNRWMADIWSNAQERLRWAAVLPLMTMDQALDELRWCHAHGACAVFMRGVEADGLPYEPRYWPIFDEAERLDIPMTFHAGNGHMAEVQLSGDETFRRSKLSVVATFHAIIEKSIPARFPKLRFGFVEIAALWLPYAVRDLQNRMKRTGKPLPDDLLASERLYVACQTDDDIPYVLEYAGEDNLVIGSDYGHNDNASELTALRRLSSTAGLNAAVVDKILATNPARLYGLN